MNRLLRTGFALTLGSTFVASVASGCTGSSSNDGDGGIDGSVPGEDGGGQPVSKCAPQTNAPTLHSGYLAASETWTAAASPHVLQESLTIQAGVTVTLEPCATVKIAKDKYLRVDGDLVAKGAADRRITVGPNVAGERFASIVVSLPGKADLAYVDIGGGGGDAVLTSGTALLANGDGVAPFKGVLTVDHVTVADSAGYGIEMLHHAAFGAGSTDLTITGAGKTETSRPLPLRIAYNVASTVPSGKYTGNAVDEIRLTYQAPYPAFHFDDTIRERGVPYRVGGDGAFSQIVVGGAGGLNPLLTIEPGVVLRFGGGTDVGLLEVGVTGGTGPQGRLRAIGTADKPIVFTSVEDKAGAWEGVNFVGTITADDAVEHVHIVNAGAHGGANGFGCLPAAYDGATDGAFKMFAEPPGAFLKSSLIKSSSAHGVFRAWNGADIDFLAGNTFEGIAGCTQVAPKSSTGTCPASPTCPK